TLQRMSRCDPGCEASGLERLGCVHGPGVSESSGERVARAARVDPTGRNPSDCIDPARRADEPATSASLDGDGIDAELEEVSSSVAQVVAFCEAPGFMLV